jgi:hypothetical protein
MRATSWDYYFSFHVSDPKSRWDSGPYSRLATLSFKGDLVRPNGIRYKQAEVTLSARAGMMDERRGETFQSIGSLTAGGNSLSAYVFIPAELMPELAAVAQSGRVQIVNFSGTRLRYRSAFLSSVSLTTRDEEEEEKEEEKEAEDV